LTARDLDHLAKPSSTEAQEASKREFLQYAASMQRKKQKSTVARLRESLVFSLVLLLLLVFSGALMAAYSGGAIPGDPLYGTKLFLEQTRLNYSANSEAAAALIKELHQERLDEIEALLSLGRSETVTFSGEVETLSQDRWIVAGLPVEISSQTMLPDEVEVGFLVQISGRTSDGAVLADQVEVIAGPPQDPNSQNPDSSEQLTPTPMPTIEPLNIPERPDFLLPDNESQTNPAGLLPAPTATLEVDTINNEDAGDADENVSGSSEEPGNNEDQSENNDGSDKSEDDSNDESDEREDNGYDGNDAKDEYGSENSEEQEEVEEEDSAEADTKEGDEPSEPDDVATNSQVAFDEES
jgi:hypothetical protein